jgi:serine/threonine protein phosphatase PrpC
MTYYQPLDIRYAQRSDIGKKRQANEDTSAVYEMIVDGVSVIIAAVADGMGGAHAGAEASQLAIKTAVSFIASRLESALPTTEQQWQALLCDALYAANGIVYSRSRSNQQLNGMGTTLLVGVLVGRRVRIAHIGDCRAYVVRPAARKPHIFQLTADHTVVAQLINQGVLSHAEATSHPQRHQLARSLGCGPSVEPEITARTLRSGERLLLCSDGLPLHLSDGDLAQAISSASSPQAACDRLVDLANQRGGRDNITVVVLAADRAAQ